MSKYIKCKSCGSYMAKSSKYCSQCGTKNKRNRESVWKRVGIFFGAFLLYHILLSSFFPVDENNTLQAPDWYMDLGMVFSLLVAIFYDKVNLDFVFQKLKNLRKPQISKSYNGDTNNFIPPRTKKGQEAALVELIESLNTSISLAKETNDVSLFVSWYDQALNDFSKIMSLDKIDFKFSSEYYRTKWIKDEFQLHLCDAIIRAKEATISEINGRYKNSREFQRKALEGFELDLNRIRPRFSPDTAELADKSVRDIKTLLGLGSQEISDDSKYQQCTRYGGTEAVLLSVDLMEGHEFEHWCAGLLEKNGFINVTVTPGSGDQGVDVLAEKGGVRYAIQCKCYSKDLGNTPVQEVAAGKSLPSYHCQVGAVMTNRHFTKGAQELAQANGILLWDRDHLRTMIESANN